MVYLETIRKNPKNQDWVAISYDVAILNKNFIREFQNYINWGVISWHKTLSEEFIREFQDKVNWYYISCYQRLSKEFVIEFSDKINFTFLMKNNNISDEIKDLCKMFV